MWMLKLVSANKKTKRSPRYSEFNGDRMEKTSMHSYGYAPYAAAPPQTMMLAAYPEIQGYNPAYQPGTPWPVW